MNKLTAGKDIDSYCTKCRLELGHLIVAMVEDKVAKVKCNTCNSVHNYREVKKVQKTSQPDKKPTTKKIQKNKGKAPEVSWEDRISKARGAEIPYEMEKAFKIGDIIAHKLFGRGIVLLTSPNKCKAVFQDKERMLVSSN